MQESFSYRTKTELARINVEKRCCQLAELAAILRMSGVIQISGNHQLSLKVVTEHNGVARKLFILFKKLFTLPSEIIVKKETRLHKQNLYEVHIPPHVDVRSILETLGIIHPRYGFSSGINISLAKRPCCKRAFLRGSFLGGGSVNDPGGDYHLEIVSDHLQVSKAVCQLINSYGLHARISKRKNEYVVYLKEGEQIVQFLSIIGAHTALLNFENVRILKEMRNQVNRLVNCETANLGKTVQAAMRQVEKIKLLKAQKGFDDLSPGLREMAELRLQYPEASLKELGELLSDKVSKSGVNHRLRKLEQMADELSGESAE